MRHKMAELLVPEVNLSANGEVTFYKVVSSSVNQEDFAINGIHQSNKEKYKNKGFDFDCIFEKAPAFLESENIKSDLKIYNHKNIKDKVKEIQEATQSVTLGILLELFREQNRRSYKSRWDYIIVTGNLSSDNSFEEVSAIQEKFEGIKKLAAEDTKKQIIFLYINNSLPIAEGFDKEFENLYVSGFKTDASREEIFAEIFKPVFSEEQERLLKKTELKSNSEFYETEDFFNLKKEIKNWNGFLITGRSNSGKTMLASALSRYLMESNFAYAPVWLRINNDEIQKILKPQSEEEISKNPLCNKSITKRKSLTEYFSDLIEEAKIDPQKKYIIVLDNLEFDFVDSVLETLEKIILRENWISFTIITSWNKTQSKNLLGKLKLKEVELKAIKRRDFNGIYQSIIKDYYKNNLQKASEEEQKKIEELAFKWLQEKPGNIYLILDSLNKISVKSLIEELEKAGPGDDEKDAYFYSISFSQLSLFAKIVLYNFIATFACEGKTCNKRDFDSIQEKIAEEDLVSADLFYASAVEEAFKELTSHYLIQENFSGEFSMKNDVLKFFLFQNKSENLPKALKTYFLESDKIHAAVLYGWKKYLLSLQEKENILQAFWDIASYSSDLTFLDSFYSKNFININAANKDGLTALGFAALNNTSLDVFKYLLEKGADYHVLTNIKSSILQLSVKNQNPDILRYILEQRLYDDINAKNEDGHSALWLAAVSAKNYQIFELLEAYGAKSSSEEKDSLLLDAVGYNQNLETVSSFIEKSGKSKEELVRFSDSEGNTLLHMAAGNPESAILKYILDNHLYEKIDVKTSDGITPLFFAGVLNTNPNVIDLLIKNGASWHKANIDNLTSFLAQSAQYNNKKIISHILEKKYYDENSLYTKNHNNLFHFAVLNPELAVLKEIYYSNLFKDNLKKINQANDDGETPLLIALEKNENLEIAKFLIDMGADCQVKTEAGLTCLLSAAKNRNPKVLEYVLDKGLYVKSIRECDNSGLDLLAYSAMYQNPQMLNRLADEYGFDKNKKYEMRLYNHPEKKLNQPDTYDLNLLHLAAMSGNEAVVEALARESEMKSAEIFSKKMEKHFLNLLCKFGKDSASEAWKALNRQTFTCSLKEKAKIYLPYSDKGNFFTRTALDIAIECNHPNIIKILKEYCK